MALPFFHVRFPVATSLPTTAATKTPPTLPIRAPNFSKIPLQRRSNNRFTLIIPKSTKEEGKGGGGGGSSTDEATSNTPAEMEELKRPVKEESGLLIGVAEEIGEIEWPGFGKVLGTTGVVLGVIAGSSVVLLTVNAVLAEISDKVFAGKGIQDLFG